MGRDRGGNRCFVDLDIYYRVTWIRVWCLRPYL